MATIGELAFSQSMPEPIPQPQLYKEVDKQMMVVGSIRLNYDFIKVRSVRAVYGKEKGPGVYTLYDEDRLTSLVRDYYFNMFHKGEAKRIKEAVATFKLLITEEIDEMSNDVVSVSDHLYWDAETGQLSKRMDKPCFRRLFSTKYESKHVVKVDDFSDSDEEEFMEVYKERLKEYLASDSVQTGVRFPFIMTWADGNEDVYWDILRSIAYCFVKKKPVGSYMLIGEKRNGKSTFVGLLHTIFGTNNTSMVRLSQLGDWHYVNSLRSTVLNAPDEEDDKVTEAQANFKIMADHGILNLSVMRSNEPLQVPCDFMAFYPMNHLPKWSGSGASACMQRTLILPFYADLSEYDKSSSNFAKATYTKDTMVSLMAEVFAIATYYSTHDLEFSDTMLMEREGISREVDNVSRYRELFQQFFDGFESMDLLYTDYVNWAKSYDYQIAGREQFKFMWRSYKEEEYRYGNMRLQIFRKPKAGHMPLLRYTKYDKMRVEYLHSKGQSIVLLLANRFYEKPINSDEG